jgi:hypothetical protein
MLHGEHPARETLSWLPANHPWHAGAESRAANAQQAERPPCHLLPARCRQRAASQVVSGGEQSFVNHTVRRER